MRFNKASQRLTAAEAIVICVVVLLPLSWWLGHLVMEPVKRLLRALEGAVASYRDGDFSISIALNRRDELGDLIRVHNELGQTLREQRQNLAQRELLLDTVVQNTPVALVLTDAVGRVAYANIAATAFVQRRAQPQWPAFRDLDRG